MAANILDGLNDGSDEFVIAFSTSQLPFSNWSAHQVIIWGEHFPTAEHAYQYKKFADNDAHWALKIQHAKSPWLAKKLAWRRKIDKTWWDSIREDVMKEILAAKLNQHEDVRTALSSTGKLAIVEKSKDANEFWGVGPNNKGLNTLGKIWMLLRQEYR